MTVGFICIFAAFKGYTASDFGFINAGGVDTIACAPPNGIFDLSAGQKVEFGGLVFTQEFIDANNCANPCSVPFAGRGALFRSNDDLTTLRVKDMEDMWNGPALSEKRQEMNIFAFGYLNYALWLLPYILGELWGVSPVLFSDVSTAQGICAACFPRKSPSQVRDFLYLYFRDGRWGRPGGRRHMVWARLIATGAYLWAVLMLVLCPPLFVINLIAIEFVINPLSQREASNHVSAWGPWASTGLVLFAAFIARFQHSIVRILGEMIREFGFRVKHTWHRFLRWTAGKSNNAYLKEVNSRGGPHMLSWGDRQGSNAPYPGIVRNTERHVWTEVWETFGHYIHRVSHAWEAIRKEWVEFIAFLKNPESVRERSDEAIVLEKSGTKGRKLQKQPSTAAGGAAYVGYGQPKLTDEEDANAVPLARQPRNMHESNSSGSGGIWTDSQTSAHPIDDDEAHLPPRPPPTTLHQSSFRSQRSESSPNETPAFSTLPSPYGDLAHLIHSPSELPADSLLGYSSNNLSQSLSDAITTRNTRHSAYAQELSPRPPPLSPPIPAPTQHPRRNPDHGWDANPSTSAPSTPAPMTHSTSTLLVDTGPAPAMVSPNGPPPNTPAGFSSDASTAETGHGSRAASGNRSHDVTPRSGEDDTTAGWLHVRRPASMTIRDEIRLRRDEWGVYQVIEE
jgi:hypothetical protein